MTSNFLFKPK